MQCMKNTRTSVGLSRRKRSKEPHEDREQRGSGGGGTKETAGGNSGGNREGNCGEKETVGIRNRKGRPKETEKCKRRQ